MAENLIIAESADREARYRQLIPQLESLTSGEPDLIANLANVVAAIRQTFGFFWIGFYLVRDNELVLGPFQGPIACTRIGLGKGVCGTSWKEKKTIVVPDVDLFPGHIACSSDSKSEIVLPAFKNDTVALVLDIDSNQLNDFTALDARYLEQVMRLVEKFL
ncbi:MAG TPA: GAF domain-containing protein [Cyclobacteriaceae bacterium]|jgi:GAF domain-containing protein|nr:GAF domain-containing protein [Cyclobacteriaceae bacterium]